ncbi:hypothetical protein C4544_01925 [candidate division WS5 bacterium]|uniref:Uncharacterized protein n=1 Tax=candidate division WS5 bacterium TaxID=2093353 RepID=A0A419DF57_9BACT|nr:MAG: hypothetical protein C4544_01925 [candidate division WS5 bacterium]
MGNERIKIITHHGRGFISRVAHGRKVGETTRSELFRLRHGNAIERDDAIGAIFQNLYGFRPMMDALAKNRFCVRVHPDDIEKWETYEQGRISELQALPSVSMPSCGGGDFPYPFA